MNLWQRIIITGNSSYLPRETRMQKCAEVTVQSMLPEYSNWLVLPWSTSFGHNIPQSPSMIQP
jgi:hypothetical protein